MVQQSRVGVVHFEFFIPEAHSLKEKRMFLRRVKDRLGKFNASVAEVAHQDLWQRSVLAVAMVSGDAAQLEKMVDQVAREVEDLAPAELVRQETAFL